MHAFTKTPSPRYLVSDTKFYHEHNAFSLKGIAFITRIPNTFGVVSQVITQALEWNTWQPFDDNLRYQSRELCHYGMAQRWLLVYSQAALERAAATLTKAKPREHRAIPSNSFTCKPNACVRPVAPKMPWRR